MRVITKNHAIFGKIRFIGGHPFLYDIGKSLNYDNFSYINLISNDIFKIEDNIVINDNGINTLISNSNIEVPTLYKEWLFDFILPLLRNKLNNNSYISKPKGNKDSTLFKSHLKQLDKSKWITIPVHGFSNNFMYSYTKDGKIVKSDAYKRWYNDFPYSYLSQLSHIDFTKPIQAYYIFDQLEKFDTPNLSKSLSDIIANYFNADDHFIVNQVSIRGKIVNSFEEGKIHIYMYNI